MNLAEMVETTVNYLNDPRQTRFKRPQIIRHLNRSQEEVKRKIAGVDETMFTALQDYAVVSSDDSLEFTLPTDFSLLLAAEDVSQSVPVPAHRVEFATRHDNYDDRVLPVGMSTSPTYYLRGNKLGIVRPKTAYTLRIAYVKELTELSDDADESEIPKDYHDLVCLGAAKRAYGSVSRPFPPELEMIRQETIRDMLDELESRDVANVNYPNVSEY